MIHEWFKRILKDKKGKSCHYARHGTARDAKAGAVVVRSNGSPVYIDHLDSWPDDVLGCKIEAKGTLVVKKYIPDSIVDEGGSISQGADGDQDVLKDALWKII